MASVPVLTPRMLAELADVALAEGLVRLGVVRLDHPGFAESAAHLRRWLAEGRHGDMEFMARSAQVRQDPAAMLDDALTVLVAAAPYRGEASPIARYAQWADYHTVVHRRLDAVARALGERLPDVRTLICVDTKPLMERAAAALAGLGFLGKNGCLIVPGLGSYLLLGAILTTADWKGDQDLRLDKVRWDACGSCTRCLDACPTAAFDAPGTLDPRRCISYLTIEHRGEIEDALADRFGERIFGCDVCQEVCPYNASQARSDRIPPAAWIEPPPGGTRSVDLVALADLRSGRYRAFVRGTAIGRIPRRHLRRNALIALGNRPGPLDETERAAVDRALDDPEPLVRTAARRALRRRG